MKVIFLDIDGVMNSHVFYEEQHKKQKLSLVKRLLLFLKLKHPVTSKNYKFPKDYYTFEYQFDRLKEETCLTKWKWLSEWCNENNVKICISSVWRNHFGVEGKRTPELWDKALTLLGFNPNTYMGITTTRESLRGQEIKHFLDNNPQITDYAILDDDSDMLSEQFCKFHHCDAWFGLSPNHLYRIKRQFDKKSSYEKLSEILKET